MSKTFQLKVNDSFSFDINNEDISTFDALKKSENQYHVINKNKTYDAVIVHSDFITKNYAVQVNGNRYEVKISHELDLLISELGLEANSEKKENDVKAPMPGLIVSINVKEGQSVAEGEGIIVLEAMKMENTLQAPREGTIKSISVKVGDKVEKNTVLIEME